MSLQNHGKHNMDPYDSDSSLEDGKDYTETNVYLGFASKQPTEDTISHLGGLPVRQAQLSSPKNGL